MNSGLLEHLVFHQTLTLEKSLISLYMLENLSEKTTRRIRAQNCSIDIKAVMQTLVGNVEKNEVFRIREESSFAVKGVAKEHKDTLPGVVSGDFSVSRLSDLGWLLQ